MLELKKDTILNYQKDSKYSERDFKRYFKLYKVPFKEVLCANITPSEKLILLSIILSYQELQADRYLAVDSCTIFAKGIGMSPISVQRGLSSLSKQGYIEVSYVDFDDKSKYVIKPNNIKMWPNGDTLDTQSCDISKIFDHLPILASSFAAKGNSKLDFSNIGLSTEAKKLRDIPTPEAITEQSCKLMRGFFNIYYEKVNTLKKDVDLDMAYVLVKKHFFDTLFEDAEYQDTYNKFLDSFSNLRDFINTNIAPMLNKGLLNAHENTLKRYFEYNETFDRIKIGNIDITPKSFLGNFCADENDPSYIEQDLRFTKATTVAVTLDYLYRAGLVKNLNRNSYFEYINFILMISEICAKKEESTK